MLRVASALCVLAAAAYPAWRALQPELGSIRKAEALFEEAAGSWEAAIAAHNATSLEHALGLIESALVLRPLSPAPSGPEGYSRSFGRWLARPLRLSCLHRVAAARELLHSERRAAATAGMPAGAL